MEDRDEPYRAAYGTIDMSTSMGLAVIPKFIWDVNGYYRSLNIAKPYRPNRKQLREGYQSVKGQDNARLTYHFKQLLNPTVRAEYDAMPLGSRYRDLYITERDMERLATKASEVSEEEGRIVTAQDLMDEYERERPALDPLPPTQHHWNWGFYALHSRKYSTEILEQWQSMLLVAFAARDVATTISIGYIGETDDEYDVIRYQDRDIIFINENTKPTPELAETAVSSFMAHRLKGNR